MFPTGSYVSAKSCSSVEAPRVVTCVFSRNVLSSYVYVVLNALAT
jgi:hypothetical protein